MYKLSDVGFYTDNKMLIHFQKGMENVILSVEDHKAGWSFLDTIEYTLEVSINKPTFLLRITIESEVSEGYTPPFSSVELPLLGSVETTVCSNNQQQKDVQNCSH